MDEIKEHEVPLSLNRLYHPRLTPRIAKRIVDCVEGGNYLRVAAGVAGVALAIVEKWIAEGERIYMDFAQQESEDQREWKKLTEAEWRKVKLFKDVQMAQALAEEFAMSKWRKGMTAGKKDGWKPSMEYLERVANRTDYRKHKEVNVKNEGAGEQKSFAELLKDAQKQEPGK